MAAVFVPAMLSAQEPVRPRSPADPAPAAVAQDTLQDLLVEVDIESGPSQSMLALQRGTEVLLPAAAVLRLAELRVTEVQPGRRFEARLGDGRALLVATAEGRVERAGTALPWDPRAAVWHGEELYIRPELLGALLGTQAAMDWSDLVVRLTVTDDLPVVQRLARERRRSALLREVEPARPPELLPARNPLVDGLAVDWSATAATRSPEENNGLSLGLGATVLGGGLDVQTATITTPTATTTTTQWEWERAWPERRWLRQVRLGDITTGGERAFGIKGAELTNRPYLRDAAFAVQDLTGRLPAGWEIEVYRGGDLLGYQPVGASGAYAIGVPVIYGQNPLETIVYGPNGQVYRGGRTFVIGTDRLPAGRFEYSVSGGDCASVQCAAAANVDLRYGMTRRLTVQAGVDRIWRDSLPDLFHPYGRAVFAATRPLALTAEGVLNGFARGRADLDPSPDLHADASVTRFDTTVVQPLVGSASVAWLAAGNLFWRPGVFGSDLYLQAAATWQRSADRIQQQWRWLATDRVLGVRLTGGVRLDDDRLAGLAPVRRVGVDAGADGVVARGRLRNTLLGATLGAECSTGTVPCWPQLVSWSAALGRQLTRPLRLDVSLRKDRAVPLRLDVTLQLATPFMRATSRNSAQSGTGVNGTQVFEGTLLWDRRTGRLGMANGRNLGRAGVAGEVFLDANGNGRRDGGETVLSGVLLRIGADAVVSDSLGRFSVWDLVPFSDAIIEVDTLALENPLWVPAAATSRVLPAPNSYRFVSIPILQGGEIAGRVELNGAPLPGAQLVLREEATGRYTPIATFTDATFYVMRLPPGRYTLAAAPGLLEQLHARAEVLRFEIGGSGLLRYDDLVVRLVRD